jgi:hypothetical protein
MDDLTPSMPSVMGREGPGLALLRRPLVQRWLFALLLMVAALFAITRTNRDRRVVEAWVTDPGKHWDANLSWRANLDRRRQALREIGPAAVKTFREDLRRDPLLPRLLGSLSEWLPSWLVDRHRPYGLSKAEAAKYLGWLGPTARDAMPDLVARCADSPDWVLSEIALAIGSIGENTAEARAALNRIITNGYPPVVACAAFSLWRLDPGDTNAQRTLEGLLNGPALVMLSQPLSEMGPNARWLVPAVAQQVSQIERPQTKMNVAHAVWRMSGDPAVPLEVIKDLAALYAAAQTNAIDRTGQHRTSGYISAAALAFQDIPECRAALQTLLEQLANSPSRTEQRKGYHGLAELRRAEKERPAAPEVRE